MKLFEIPMVVTSCVGLCFLASLDAPLAHADFIFGEPVNLGPRINPPGDQGFPCISPDGLELYFCRIVSGAAYDIFVARRLTVDSEWGEPVSLGPTVNSSTYDWSLSISADGLSLYYTYGGSSGYPWRLYVTKRATKDAPWGPPASVGGAMATVLAWDPSIAPNDLELYFCSPGLGGYGSDDIWVTTRATVNDAWGPPANLGQAVNSPYEDVDPVISPDGLLLFFDSRDGSGRWGTYVTRRITKSDPWGPRTYLGSILNPPGEIGTERPAASPPMAQCSMSFAVSGGPSGKCRFSRSWTSTVMARSMRRTWPFWWTTGGRTRRCVTSVRMPGAMALWTRGTWPFSWNR